MSRQGHGVSLFLKRSNTMSQVLRNVRNHQQSAANNNGTGNAVIPFPKMLEQFKGEIARALPKHINPDRMARIALTAFRMSPSLAKCQPASIFAAVIQSSQLGLEVGLMGEAHLVPFGDQCQLIPGYQGLMKLARQSGLVVDIYAHEVRENDTFDVVLGLDRSLIHQPLKKNGFPASDAERGEIVGFYAVAKFKDGSNTFVAMSRFDVEKIRDNSRGYQAAKRYKKESLWDTDFLSMGLKTVIRRLIKFLPKSPELATAMALDAVAENGKEQGMKLDEVIEGTFVPVDDGDVSDENQADSATVGNGNGNAENATTPQNTGRSSRAGNTNASPLEKAISDLEAATTAEALDEIYIRAESSFDGADLEILLRKYRECKEKIGKLI